VTRAERIVVLVWSLPDALPAPDSWTGSLTRGQPRRAGADDPMVVGAGGPVYVQQPYVPVEGCEWCQEPLRSRWDDARKTWVPVPMRFDRLPRGSGVRGGKRCEPCEGSGWRRVSPDPERRRNGGERGIWRLPGSYSELVEAMAGLPTGAGRVLLGFCVYADRGRPWQVAAALEFVSRRMPNRISVAAGVVEAWRAREERRWLVAGPRRDQRIRQLAAQGEPVMRIAARAHLTERRVRQILKGR
jgi:hypothetical protein